MGDEDGAFHGFLEGGDGGHGNGDPLQVGEARVVDVKSEKGGDGWGEFMLDVANSLACFRAAQASCCDEDVGGFQDAAVGEVDRVTVARESFEGGDFAAGANFDVVIGRGVGEALHDGFRSVGGGEHASIGFCFEGDAMFVEPVHGVAGVEAVEGAM